jgi:hypothetical protein
MLDKWTPYAASRWVTTVLLILLFIARIIYAKVSSAFGVTYINFEEVFIFLCTADENNLLVLRVIITTPICLVF